jgi:hypothetical protein
MQERVKQLLASRSTFYFQIQFTSEKGSDGKKTPAKDLRRYFQDKDTSKTCSKDKRLPPQDKDPERRVPKTKDAKDQLVVLLM